MAASQEITHISNGNMPKKPKREIHVVKIQCLPFGFFEKVRMATLHCKLEQ